MALLHRAQRQYVHVFVAIAFSVCLGSLAIVGPARADVVVAKGKFSGQSWLVRVGADRHHRRCYELELSGQGYSTAVRCEARGRPARAWQRAIGIANDSAAVELDVTELAVRRLKLRLGHPGRRDDRPTWQSLQTQRLGKMQARSAGIDRNFRFAVIAGSGPNLCVEKVFAFELTGGLLEKLSVPCEF